ncbi:hypothetical protein EMIHUDRAFT_457041 [Emiliania huxleyi CCMP1516]|uniref:SAC3/GANP/THP3 conserved domain-containing protein n=2 Tax=Emiliania huxleyi TaxID=2903 RepID=A0A0D3JX46_EMIH1|nr:hypothetical protein EMIHUDRAFT_457041 [Emiliania huxleyi CCMP1516]EOD28081.1 hypothetical protein EMIHUDRAFT_457041 [Emiliania huxleyi CCMP1516]|eukprot:XP_005780510.1 hypothetical protein EMIHUDRAFT_457041 [Emiliania huxleyi CCMP1516]
MRVGSPEDCCRDPPVVTQPPTSSATEESEDLYKHKYKGDLLQVVNTPGGSDKTLALATLLAEQEEIRSRAAQRSAGITFGWYTPPPYSWSSLAFAPSRDDGPDGRDYADGGGWGLCSEMCPAEEAHERLRIAPNANLMETDPISGEPAAAWLVTMFHRNDAARVWKPSDIRTITALALSVEHLLCVVLPRRFPAYPAGPCPAEAAAWEASADSAAIGWEGVPGEPPFIRVASFVRDRLRQIRQELTMQQPSFSIEARQVAVDLLEQCTRFHIMVEHRCCELGVRNLPPDDAKFDSRMNMQMYTQALAGLQQLYENLRHHGVPCPNEVEFQAYYVVSAADPDVLFGRLAELPPEVLCAPLMQRALRVHAAVHGGDFGGFFRELKRAPYLMACLMHKHLEHVRGGAIAAINRSLAPKPGSSVELPLLDLSRMLLLEGREEAAQLCRHYGLQLNAAADAVLLTGTSRIHPRTDAEGHPVLTPLFRLSLIEAKRRDVPVCRLMMSPTLPPALLALAGEEAATAVLPSPRAMLNSPNATAAGLVDRTPSAAVEAELAVDRHFVARPPPASSSPRPASSPLLSQLALLRSSADRPSRGSPLAAPAPAPSPGGPVACDMATELAAAVSAARREREELEVRLQQAAQMLM